MSHKQNKIVKLMIHSQYLKKNKLPNKYKYVWPWDIEIPQFLPTMPDGSPWPKISIITPSYNQAEFIEETIRSVICQGYPNLEYIIIDGGSTDGSVEIIKKYKENLTYWVSEPDRGQAHAINKGLLRITGDIFGWINSDDMLLPNSLSKLAETYQNNQDKILLGDLIYYFHSHNKYKKVHQKNVTISNLINPFKEKSIWQQPSTFVPRKFINTNILLDENLRYVFDYDWMIRLLQITSVHYINEVIAVFRFHKKSKTVNEKFSWLVEIEIVLKRYWDLVSNEEKKQIEANIEFIKAANHLGVKQWDRKFAQKKLMNSCKIYPKIIFSVNYLQFLIRSILPFSFLKFLRKSFTKLNIFFPYD